MTIEQFRQELTKHPWRFGFAQWVRLWLGTSRHLGKAAHWEDLSGLLEIRPTGRLGFSASDLEHCDVDSAGRARLHVNFMGLRGANSPLPAQLLDGLERGREAHAALEGFLDIFDGRLYALYAQVLLHRHPSLRAEMRDPLPRQLEKLCSSSEISRRRLERVLARELEIPRIKVSDRTTEWLPVPPARLGRATLDGTLVLGRHLAVGGSRLEIQLGPVSPRQGQEISRDREGFAHRLSGVFSKHLGLPRPWRVELLLPASPNSLDGNCLKVSDPPRLGRDARIGRIGGTSNTMIFAG